MDNKGFLVQLHLHTSDTSRCGHVTGGELARACKDAGYDMIVVTDHFFNANIGCDRDLPWEEKVDYLMRGYLAAKEEGDRIGLKVLFGWETFTNGPEYLTYGLGKDFLLANPDIHKLGNREYLDTVNKAGGFVIHAHPFRKAVYIPEFYPDAESVEAFEIFNYSHKDRSFDAQAKELARRYNLIECAGSDSHTAEAIMGGAMRFPRPLETSADLIAALRNREGEVVEEL